MLKKLKFGLLTLSTVALLAACGDGDVTPDPTDPTDDPAVEEPAQNDGTNDQGTENDDVVGDPIEPTEGIAAMWAQVTLQDAIQIFFETVGEDANIDQIELDEENGRLEYSISGWDNDNEYDLDIDAETGDIREQESERDNDNDEEALNLDNIITPQEAMEIAIEETGNDFVESWTLEVDNGVPVYEIDMGGANDDDMTIHAETGEILER